MTLNKKNYHEEIIPDRWSCRFYGSSVPIPPRMQLLTADTVVAPVETATGSGLTTTATAMKEGVMTMKDGKVMVMTNGCQCRIKRTCNYYQWTQG